MDKNKVIMIGSGCIDEYYELDYVPGMGEKTICRPLEPLVGGMIGNAASVAAAYGMDTFLMDTVNRGDSVKRVLEDCIKQGIRLDLIRYDDALPDVKCIIFLKDGERIIYVIPAQKKAIEIQEEQWTILEEAGWIYSTPMELRCFARPCEVIDRFRRQGAKLVLDVEYLDNEALREEWEIMNRADILFVNAEGNNQLREKIAGDYLTVLNRNGCMVVVTRGSDGCTVCGQTGEQLIIPAYRVSPVDTTGAGDTFNASFLFGLSQGWDIRETASFASAAAARAILSMGPRCGAVGVEQVREFMNTYDGNEYLNTH